MVKIELTEQELKQLKNILNQIKSQPQDPGVYVPKEIGLINLRDNLVSIMNPLGQHLSKSFIIDGFSVSGGFKSNNTGHSHYYEKVDAPKANNLYLVENHRYGLTHSSLPTMLNISRYKIYLTDLIYCYFAPSTYLSKEYYEVPVGHCVWNHYYKIVKA